MDLIDSTQEVVGRVFPTFCEISKHDGIDFWNSSESTARPQKQITGTASFGVLQRFDRYLFVYVPSADDSLSGETSRLLYRKRGFH